MRLCVIYSCLQPQIPSSTVLSAIFSPMQNYSELWVQRFIWQEKGSDNEMIGFFHFRRYLDFSAPVRSNPAVREKKRLLPYRFCKWPDYTSYSTDNAERLVSNFDIIAPLPEKIGESVIQQYGKNSKERREDLDSVLQIVLSLFPDYKQAADDYLNGDNAYFGNIYIMRRNVLNKYLLWLFTILDEFDRLTPDQLPRTPGYLAERLFGIWITKQQRERSYQIGWLPRVHFFGYDDKNHHFRRDAVIWLFLPPGSKRRFFAKKLLRKSL